MKLYMYITDPESYFNNEHRRLTAYTYNENMPTSWIFAGEIEFEPKFDEIDLKTIATDDLDQKIKRTKADARNRINGLEVRKQNLLAIEHKTEAVSL